MALGISRSSEWQDLAFRDQPTLTVLLVEPDEPVVRSLDSITASLGNAEVAAVARSAAEAVHLAQRLAPDVAIVDLAISHTLVQSLHARCPDVRIVVIGDRSPEGSREMVHALACGAVGAIHKDGSLQDLARALTTSTPSAPVVTDEAAGVLLGSYIDAMAEKRQRDFATIQALAAALEAKDLVTGRHLHRVQKLAMSCLQEIDAQLAHNQEIAFGFLLHDVGKIGIPDAILNKPGPLTQREWYIMRRHPELGVRIVEPVGFTRSATDVILSHHERWDGLGYPHGISGTGIPVAARAFAVADAFDAMTSDRPYRRGLPLPHALRIIRSETGAAYDPDVVDVFIDLAERTPEYLD